MEGEEIAHKSKRKRKTKEHHTKDVQLAKKRKVYQNAKVIQKFRKLKEQEAVKERERLNNNNNNNNNNGRMSIYDQVFAGTDSATTHLIGNLKGRDKKYQEKQQQKKNANKMKVTSQRPNPYTKIVNQKKREERLTQEQINAKTEKRLQNLQKRKRDNKKLKRRSRRGQPVMENHVDSILAKLQAERKAERK
jgi:hypothetical protein